MLVALTAARAIVGITPAQKAVLMALADKADEYGECSLRIAQVRIWTCLGDRAIQTAITAMERMDPPLVKRIAAVGQNGRQSANIYKLQIGLPSRPEGQASGLKYVREAGSPAADAPLKARKRRPASGPEPRSSCAPEPRSKCAHPPQQMRPSPAADAGATTLGTHLEPSLNTQTDAGAPGVCADESAVARLFEVWKTADPGMLNPSKARAAFGVARAKRDPALILAAAERYLAEDRKVAAGRVAPLHSWLEGQCFDAWLGAPAAKAAEPPDPPATFPGPRSIRAAVVAETTEGFARSYLDPAGWDDERRAVLAATGLAADKLRRLGLRWLDQAGIAAILRPGERQP